MKLFCILLLALPLLGHSYPADVEKSIALDEDVDNDHAASDTEIQVEKRSGSFDYVSHLKTGLLSSIGHASASIASGSSGGSGVYKTYEPVQHGNSLEYDPWSFKKSVLNTIFQAVKAITGGVTALKGQLIKGSGYALSASGNLVAASGDKVTDVGKSIINSAHIKSYAYGPSAGASVVAVHPFAKYSSLSGASSTKHVAVPVVHAESITTYEVPHGHGSYGPPSKPPTYSSATHQYLPPSGASYSSGGAPFNGGHAAFEAPPSNYLPSSYGHDETYYSHDDFNIYPRHKKLTDAEARKAATELQEILSMLPNGKTEYTASKTVTLPLGIGEISPENVEVTNYGLRNGLGPLEGLSHTESVTAAYGAPTYESINESPSDIYHQMAKKQSPEEAYMQRHPEEGYDYKAPKQGDNTGYKYNNYHANDALKDLSPIIAALEVAKYRGPSQPAVSTQYAVEKNVYKVQPAPPQQTYSSVPNGMPPSNVRYLPPVVQKSKYTYFDPSQNRAGSNYPPVYNHSYKVRRQAPNPSDTSKHPSSSHPKGRAPLFKAQDFEAQDPLLFNQMLTF